MKGIKKCVKAVNPLCEKLKDEEVYYGPIKVGELRGLIEQGLEPDVILNIIKQKKVMKNWLIILSYDASDEFKEKYEKKYHRVFSEQELWKTVNSVHNVEISGKPVESTLLLEAKNIDDYKKVEDLIVKQFDGLYYIIGTIAKVDNVDQYDVYPNPNSEDDNF